MTLAPFLAILLTRHNFAWALWLAAGAGLLIDLLSTGLPFGCHALSYTLTIAILFFYRHYFFFDKRGALALLTGLVSLLATLIEMFLFSFFDQGLTITPFGLASDILVMPLADALYALVFFWLPMESYQLGKKMWPKLQMWIENRWPRSLSQD